LSYTIYWVPYRHSTAANYLLCKKKYQGAWWTTAKKIGKNSEDYWGIRLGW